ncbi:MAG: hypothetical protein IJO45_04615 [Oscillospiraceae bacterium]|nr:hypothetical protein [Oscillospiraceae bacterium]
MMKRLMALLLATVTVLLCACAPKEAEPTQPLEQIEETAPVLAEAEEETKPDFSGVNELEPNEKGVYQIHSAEGLANMAKHPDGKFELLWDVDMAGADWTPVGTKDAPFTGSFDGMGYVILNLNIVPGTDGYTGFFGVNEGGVASLKLQNVSISADSGFAGALAGENKGKLDMCTAISGSMTVSGKTVAGGLVGKAASGTLSFSESAVRIEAEASATVGLLGGELKNVTVEQCTFSGPMNLQGGKLFTQLAGVEENVTYTDCRWRDNTNSTEFLSEEAQQMRNTVEQAMRAQGTIEWTVDENLSFLYPTSSLHNQFFIVGETYYGIPYTGKCSPLERFNYCFNEDGTLKDFTKQIVMGYDNFDMYMGVDCSGGVYWSWVRVSPSTQWQWTHNMLQGSGDGGLAVGGYAGAEDLTDTKQIYDANSEEIMMECLALLHKGDAATTRYTDKETGGSANHTRLVAEDPVILRDAEGKIDPYASYIIMHGQGDGISFSLPNTTWVIDRKFTLQTLLTDYYVPLSNKELLEGKQPECWVTIDNDKTGKAYMTTGTVETNYRLISTTIRIKDEADEVAWEQTLFTPVDKFETARTDYEARETARSFNLAAFAAYIGEMELEAGKTYTYELSAMPATGDEYVLKTFTFVQ